MKEYNFVGTLTPGVFSDTLARTRYTIIDDDGMLEIIVGEKSRTPRLVDILDSLEEIGYEPSRFIPQVHNTKHGQCLVFTCGGTYFLRSTKYGSDDFVRLGSRSKKIPSEELLSMIIAICNDRNELLGDDKYFK